MMMPSRYGSASVVTTAQASLNTYLNQVSTQDLSDERVAQARREWLEKRSPMRYAFDLEHPDKRPQGLDEI